MKKFLMVLLLGGVAAGVVWYEQQPQTITIPVETEDTAYYEEPTTTTPPTTAPAQRHEIDYSHPDVVLEVHGYNGDDVTLREVFGTPKPLDQLASDTQAAIRDCPGVTDRDMVVPIDSQIELNSSLPAEVDVDYGALEHTTLFEFSSGATCRSNGTHYELKPGNTGHLRYWVVLSGAITPDHPDGDFANVSWVLDGLSLTLPGLQGSDWKLYGPRVVSCGTILGDKTEIWIAGAMPQLYDGCRLASS